ncbi:endonuclease/exonuclease/phosphatase family protein [Tabrizicola sp. J26]|uniref:endonuclease/exonuclease/phosphatase family protein n=1 Tax=Alitabrizicola rongguiensis TaxID=2909234 RepID=UPI001F2BA7D1|nr:endonuclease/exonuclease/phosphatase family protein [Tabrizicola rongguiensis]MCF1707684.1 endonuclease/exonuclease/phosphatase family protein [Tabrizicola rongguiensis]
MELTREGPGLLYQSILSGDDPQVGAVTAVIARANADVLVLQGIDYDTELRTLSALAEQLRRAGAVYPYRFAWCPNSGLATGLDLDGDGRKGGPRDAQGYGDFAGAGGMAVLSRLPVDDEASRDFSALPWKDLPQADLPPGWSAEVAAVQRLPSTGHWDIAVTLPDQRVLHLLAWNATPPVFDGPEDRNGRRNHDETAFWLRLLDGELPWPSPPEPFVILGDAELDPAKGEGRPAALAALLADPRLQSPLPPGTETADFRATGGPGPLQLDYLLPSASLGVRAAGVIRPEPGDPLAGTIFAASRHRLVWVDLDLPGPAAP